MISSTAEARCSEAQAFLADLCSRIRVRAAVLDHWGGIDRIVYDAPCMDDCPPECAQCPLYQALNATGSQDSTHLITTLVPASPQELDLLPAKQRCSNCKPYDQYLECLVAWIVEGCTTREQIEEALILLQDSRLLHMEGVTDLAAFERTTKRIVVRESIVRSGRAASRVADRIVRGFADSIAGPIAARSHEHAGGRISDRAAMIATTARHLGLLT